MQLSLWTQPELMPQAQVWQQRLLQWQVHTELQVLAQPLARHLRQHTELALVMDQQGLSLAANGMKMQPDWVGQLARLKRASHRNELIARACQTERQPIIVDATAGLGHDGLLLAWLGARVILIERHPLLAALLQDAHAQAAQHPELASVMQRIQLIHAEAADYLQQLPAGLPIAFQPLATYAALDPTELVQSESRTIDVVYLDPMFPKGGHKDQKKQALVKKEMQILHQLMAQDGAMDLGDYLLPLAQQVAARVIVKRPRHAPTLGSAVPQHQWLGDACRFDGYFQPALSSVNIEHSNTEQANTESSKAEQANTAITPEA